MNLYDFLWRCIAENKGGPLLLLFGVGAVVFGALMILIAQLSAAVDSLARILKQKDKP